MNSIFCQKCNFELPIEAMYCEKCGSKIISYKSNGIENFKVASKNKSNKEGIENFKVSTSSNKNKKFITTQSHISGVHVVLLCTLISFLFIFTIIFII